MIRTSRTRASIYWVGAAQIVSKILGFVRQLLLYRLLARSLLGFVGMGDLVINTLLLFQEMGFTSALVYRKDRTEEAADTSFWVVMTSSLILYGIAFLAAAPLLHLVSSDAAIVAQVVPILRLLALTIPISGLSVVQLCLATKELDFKRRVVPEVLSAATNLTVVVILALQGRGVWAIVYGRLAECTTLAVLMWLVTKWRPRLRFDRGLAREMFGYARHIIGSQIAIFFIKNIDSAFISRFKGAYDLAGYDLAYTLANRPATETTRLFGLVMFPAFSRVQDDIAEMRRIFLRATRYLAYVSIPLSVCIVIFADRFLSFAYGGKFDDSLLPLRVLAVYGLLRSIAANMGSVFKAGGKPNWLFAIAIVRLVVMATLLYPATVYFGILGVSALSSLVSIVDFGVSAYLVNRILHARWRDYVSIIVPPLLISIAAGWVANAIWPYVAFMKGYFSLPLVGAIMLILYSVVLWLIDPEARRLVQGLFDDLWQRGRLILRAREG